MRILLMVRYSIHSRNGRRLREMSLSPLSICLVRNPARSQTEATHDQSKEKSDSEGMLKLLSSAIWLELTCHHHAVRNKVNTTKL